jgi:putative hemolysin
MKELPTPTFPLSQHFLTLSASFLGIPRIDWGSQPRLRSPGGEPEAHGITATWAENQDEVRAAQRLRFAVFAREMGARLPTAAAYPEHDIDIFDDYCEHLLVRDRATQEVVGTYRVLTPTQAKRIGTTYTDTEFDLTRLRAMRERMVELGRSCVHKDYRHGGVIMALGGALFEFMQRNHFETMVGCASIPTSLHGAAGGNAAASIWKQVRVTHLAPIEHQAFPRRPLPLDQLDDSLPVDPPALVKGYLRLGAKVLGPPAWDPTFHTADLPIMARLEDLPARYRRHFLGA